MKNFFTLVLLLLTLGLSAQNYNNEWIDFSKTYYKFKVGSTGLYRIPQSVLAGAGMGSVDARNFQLFRNGKEVPIYTTVASGALGSSDYIEFWGLKNDGAPDNPLYRSPAYQHTQALSLETDTAVYFLTVNTTGATFRQRDTVNNVSGSVLTPEPYLTYTTATYFKSPSNFPNPGFAQIVGEYIYSSSYDIGEFWATDAIGPGGPYSDTKNSLNVYTGGGTSNASIKFGLAGAADNARTIQVSVNGSQVDNETMNSFNDLLTTKTVPLAALAGGGGVATVTFTNSSAVGSDRMVASFYELTYPRTWNFNGQNNFAFELPGKSSGYLLNITNFAIAGGSTPVLYDLTGGARYTAVVNAGTLSFALGGFTATHKFILVNEDPSTVKTVTGLVAKRFVDYSSTSNQGNYIIISNPVLYTGSNGNNPVVDYKNYRSTVAGGGFVPIIADIYELVDQFAFGIKMHPLSIQNFLRFARAKFTAKPQFALLIGHGMIYTEYYNRAEGLRDPIADQLQLVPTFGNPGSDNKLAVNNGVDAVPVTPIGRVSVVSGPELEIYLNKVKEYEQVQETAPNTLDGRLWMKNGTHLTGVSEPFLGAILCNYMNDYANIIAGNQAGANVTTFCDGNASTVSQVPSATISNIFSTGMSQLCYFGHSSNQVLSYNLNSPQDYNNPGKYPILFINGCDAGDFFVYDAARVGAPRTLSESWVLANNRGSIAFVASTHFGIVNYLNILLTGLYTLMDSADYGKPLGILQKDALQNLLNVAPNDYFARLHAEEMTTHGDPYIKMNQGPTDYIIEPSQVQINPSFISVSNSSFNMKARFYNVGRAVSGNVVVQVKRTYPNGTTDIILNKTIPAIKYSDSIELSIPIVSTRDKGANKITVSINPDKIINEVTYVNNSVTTDVFIYQDEATPIFPYNYSIINTPSSKLVASTANPLAGIQQFAMELDTTQNFNSPMKVSKNLSSVGGILEFDPGVSYLDSVVYYWRVGIVPTDPNGNYTWNYSSFTYIDPAHSSEGFNQSHYYQHQQSTANSMQLSTDRKWKFLSFNHDIYQTNTIYPTGGTFPSNFAVTVDGNQDIQSACVGASLIFNVFDPVSFKAWRNVDDGGANLHLSGSGDANCGPTQWWNFEFSYLDPVSRNLMVRFMDSIPNGYWVTVKNVPSPTQSVNTYTPEWWADTATYGHGNSIRDRLYNAGMAVIDSFTTPRSFVFIYKKGDPSFTPQYKISKDNTDQITLESLCPGPILRGNVVSPTFGPSKKWQNIHWRGTDLSNPATDTVGVRVIGIDTLGRQDTLFILNRSAQDFDISSIDAKRYPNLKLQMTTADTVHGQPYQLNMWRVNYTPVAEGALAPALLLKAPDTVAMGQPYEFAIAFKNISPYAFDSMRIKLYVLDKGNVMHVITLPRRKPLLSGDTLRLDYILDTKGLAGANTMYVGFNPDNDQPEQFLFNNFLYKNFYVRDDNRSPTLDVTFDNVHILNNDIVSAKPHIQIKLQSQSQYLLLNDTSMLNVQLQFPDGSVRTYGFHSDTLRFTPASSANNNVATVDFNPAFIKQYSADGDTYTLIVSGKDQLGNSAGATPYRVSFKIITKAMISNMLNYPNPFTTSTAFVFTITGSEVPQNIKIQILTITGKVVREITKEELGPLHVGRNITEFKWNGTDMYGQRLANGVYLYHVVTNLNGKSLDKYKASGDNTDKFFNNGYGKMYLMK
ncbi:MAG: hypothetical protein JST68_18235 [Bacteroidetes bacterium]|nr:hypothetical protein [Bacteroidota bacterium]